MCNLKPAYHSVRRIQKRSLTSTNGLEVGCVNVPFVFPRRRGSGGRIEECVESFILLFSLLCRQGYRLLRIRIRLFRLSLYFPLSRRRRRLRSVHMGDVDMREGVQGVVLEHGGLMSAWAPHSVNMPPHILPTAASTMAEFCHFFFHLVQLVLAEFKLLILVKRQTAVANI